MIMIQRAKNIANKSYQSCYTAQGFSNSFYWSSITHPDSSDNAWGVNFSNGNDNISYHKNDRGLVRCVRGR